MNRMTMVALLILLLPGAAMAKPQPADTVLLNGAVLVFHGVEVRPASEHGPVAAGANEFRGRQAPEFQEAVAIAGGRIFFVGPTKNARAYIGPATKVYDLGGRMVMPGIVDGHFHGTRSSDCPMGYQGGTIPRILARLQACLDSADQAPLKQTNTRFVALSFFGEAVEPPGTMLTRQDLDRLDTTRPVLVRNADGHKFWLNSKAIANAGIKKETPDPADGALGRDADGEPNGFFADYDLPSWGDERPATDAMRLERVAQTQADANREGITSIFVPGGGEDQIAFWSRLQDQGRMTVRADLGLSASFVRGNSDAADLHRRIADLAAFRKQAKGLITVDAVKVYCDGVMEYPAQTAAMLAPYRTNAGTAAAPDWRPGPSRGPDPSCADARAGFVALDRAGWQIHVHAIGDRATRDALDNFEAARQANGAHDRRHTITHLQAIDPADIPRFGRLGVVASMSLQWPRRDGYSVDFTRGYIADEVYDRMYPAFNLWRTGAVVAGGSDYPVDPLKPFVQIETAITRTGEPGPGVYPGPLAPSEAIPDLLAVLRMHTINAAYEMHQEQARGSIETGRDADLIVLDQNLFKIPVTKISDTRVLLTMLGGKVVYDAGTLAPATKAVGGR
ncbi:MAG TPA: amidohydrolase family protein [Candidatus Polarisedimenticolia bacterium]|nr:amidohydrolase family protein [Candidatus Polarisedimenticolia bacterium]